jgi:hypothetical protein
MTEAVRLARSRNLKIKEIAQCQSSIMHRCLPVSQLLRGEGNIMAFQLMCWIERGSGKGSDLSITSGNATLLYIKGLNSNAKMLKAAAQ